MPKRLPTKRPKDIDIEKLFTEYSQREYIPFLQESDNDIFIKRLRDMVDEDQAISTFVRDNVDRIWIFLDKHYKKKFHYDNTYNKWLAFTNKIPYHFESAETQHSYLSRLYRIFILEFMYEFDLAQKSDLNYISPNAINTDKTRPYAYRLHPRLYASDVEWISFRLELNAKIYNSYKGIGDKKFIDQINFEYSDTVKAIKEHNKQWDLDYKSIPEGYDGEIGTYDIKKMKGYFDQSHRDLRLQTPEIEMKSELRKFLYHGDNIGQVNKMVDITNAQPFLFGTLLLIEMDLDDHTIDEIDKLGIILSNIINSSNKSKFIDVLSKLIERDIFEPTDFNQIFDELVQLRPALKSLDKQVISEAFNTDKYRDYLTYILLTQAGLIYDVVSKYIDSNCTRSEFKKSFNATFNLKKDQFDKDYGVQRFFRIYMNDFYKYLVMFRKNSYKNYWYQITRMESNLMIEHVCKELLQKDIPFVLVHDGILVEESYALQVKHSIQKHCRSTYGLTAPVDIKGYARVPRKVA